MRGAKQTEELKDPEVNKNTDKVHKTVVKALQD